MERRLHSYCGRANIITESRDSFPVQGINCPIKMQQHVEKGIGLHFAITSNLLFVATLSEKTSFITWPDLLKDKMSLRVRNASTTCWQSSTLLPEIQGPRPLLPCFMPPRRAAVRWLLSVTVCRFCTRSPQDHGFCKFLKSWITILGRQSGIVSSPKLVATPYLPYARTSSGCNGHETGIIGHCTNAELLRSSGMYGRNALNAAMDCLHGKLASKH